MRKCTLTKLYDALLDGGALDEKARRATEAVAAYEGKFADVKADLLVIKWMVGLVLAAVVVSAVLLLG